MRHHQGKACIDLSHLQRALAIALAVGLAACSSTPRPTEQVDAARAAVAQAASLAVGDGATELRVAQYKLARAEQEMERGDYTSAHVFAEQAQVDAQYAWTLAENARMQRAAADVNRNVRLLQDELDRRAK